MQRVAPIKYPERAPRRPHSSAASSLPPTPFKPPLKLFSSPTHILQHVWPWQRWQGELHSVAYIRAFGSSPPYYRVSVRAAPSVTARFFATTSRVRTTALGYFATKCLPSCRYHQARYPSSCPPRWCQAYFRSHLRGDPWCPQDLP